ncbi:MAG TPA: hypothetical protein PKK69_03060, partial [Ferruginibacter sp.]|nr:hypothetical protein [Ferruginibacter sp.]
MNRRKLRYQWRAWLLGCLLGGGNMLTAQSIHSDVSPKAIRIGERITVWVAVALPDSNTSVSIGW